MNGNATSSDVCSKKRRRRLQLRLRQKQQRLVLLLLLVLPVLPVLLVLPIQPVLQVRLVLLVPLVPLGTSTTSTTTATTFSTTTTTTTPTKIVTVITFVFPYAPLKSVLSLSMLPAHSRSPEHSSMQLVMMPPYCTASTQSCLMTLRKAWPGQWTGHLRAAAFQRRPPLFTIMINYCPDGGASLLSDHLAYSNLLSCPALQNRLLCKHIPVP